MKAKTKSISFFLSLILILSLFLSVTATAFTAESLPPEQITLYAIDSWAQDYMAIPDEYPQSFQIDTSSLLNPTFSSLDPDSVSVSESGLITPAAVYTYWYGYISYSEPQEGKTPTRITAKYNYDGGDIKIATKNRTFFIHVNIADYALIYAENVDLYYLDGDYRDYLTLPSDCPQSYQVPTQGMTDPRIMTLNSNDITVENGVAKLTKITWYFYGNVGYSSPISGKEPDHITETVSSNGGYVTASDGKTTRLYHINAVNYAYKYAMDMMFDYVNENITPDMSSYEKVDAIARFVASKEYDYHYCTATGMMVTGGGDCWASTDAVVKMAQMAGLESWSRNGNKDYGAGGGHTNAMVYDGENYYEVEAGYSMSAPRYYSVTKRDSLFSVHSNSDGAEVYQYDNNPYALNDTLFIPREIDGKKVTAIGDYFGIDHCLQYDKRIETIEIPDTVTSIGTYAFYYMGSLKEITIPASVTSIGEYAFTYHQDPNTFYNTDDSKFIIRGFKGTAAETYANEHGMIFEELKVLVGDVDRNSIVSVTDASLIQRHIAKIDAPYSADYDVADVDDNKDINIMDVTLIQKWLSNMNIKCRVGQPLE